MAARARASTLALSAWAILAALCCSACQRTVERTWPSGHMRSEGRISRVDGLEQGLWTWWFPDGVMREQGRMQAGRRVGRWRQWHSNGMQRSEGSRRWDPETQASPREGAWRFWFEGGQLEGTGSYVRGLREGQWDYFLTNGELDGVLTGEYHADKRLH